MPVIALTADAQIEMQPPLPQQRTFARLDQCAQTGEGEFPFGDPSSCHIGGGGGGDGDGGDGGDGGGAGGDGGGDGGEGCGGGICGWSPWAKRHMTTSDRCAIAL